MKVWGAVVCDCTSKVAFRIEDAREGGCDTVYCWGCGEILSVIVTVAKIETPEVAP